MNSMRTRTRSDSKRCGYSAEEPSDAEPLSEAELYKRASLKAMSILERIDKSEAELRRKLIQTGYSEDIAERAVEYVKSFHYIDDERFAQNYVRSHASSLSRREITNKLMQKGVSSENIAAAFEVNAQEHAEQLEYEEALGKSETALSPELNAAIHALRKKLNGKTSVDDAAKRKLFAFMYRKGYRRDDIIEAFDTLNIEVDSGEFDVNNF